MSGALPCRHRKSNKVKSPRSRSESPREADKEDVEDEGDGERSPSVLWEKHFQQSIFVDIGDDESLHLSDLHGSFDVHVSRGTGVSESVSPSGSTGLSSSCEVEEGSLGCPGSISKCSSHNKAKDMKVHKQKTSVPQPTTSPERPQLVYADDTSDEEQDELPFDDELHHNATHYTNSTKQNVTCFENLKSENVQPLSKPNGEEQPPWLEPNKPSVSIPEVLLRHFSQDELLKCSRLIESETMPEVSLLESIETVLSRSSLNPRANTGNCSKDVKSSLEENECKNQTASEGTDSKTGSTGTAVQRNGNADQLDEWNGNQSHFPDYSRVSCVREPESSACNGLMLSEKTRDYEQDNVEQPTPPHLPKVGLQGAERSLGRTHSCGELKYGQGQVHYRLPDFSKVAPKVKIPKGNAYAKPGSNLAAMDRTSTMTGILGKSPSSCRADVISRVLEDSFWQTERPWSFIDKKKQARVDQFLQDEYDKLLAKYADDDNLISPTRLKKQTQSTSEPSLSTHLTLDVLDITCSKDKAGASFHTSQPTTTGLVEERKDAVQSVLTEQQNLTDGYRLTAELTDIVKQFMIKVNEFKTCISNTTMPVEEQQMIFKSLVEAQDQLERSYMSKKEEHRALEMQNYMGLNRNTGEFDPDRQVEGEIFRVGMVLEDIKEQIDRNACRELCPSPSSFTVPPLHGAFTSPSIQPTLHEESVFSFTSGHSKVEEGEHFKPRDEEPSAADRMLSCPKDSPFGNHISNQTSFAIIKEDDCMSVADEEDHGEVFVAQLTDPASPKQHRASYSPENVEPQDKTQRFATPEGDSGFSTSDLSRPATELSHTVCNDENLSSSDEVASILSMNIFDKEASHSNLQTVVSNALWDGCHIKDGTDPGQLPSKVQNLQLNDTIQSAPAELHTTREAPLCEDTAVSPARLQKVDQEEWSASPQIQRSPANEMLTIDNYNQRQHCSCTNSEVIRALQYEVSCLKRALQESLAHLPHLSMQTERVNSVYTQEKRVRPRPRPRHQLRAASSSKPLNTDLSLQEEDDWIRSANKCSKCKGTDSEESDRAEMQVSSQHFHSRSPFFRSNDMKYSSTASLERVSLDTCQSRLSDNHRRTRVELTDHGSDSSIRPSSRGSVTLTSYDSNSSIEHTDPRSKANRRPSGENRIKLKDRHCLLSSRPLHKPLLQVSYGSCCSLPPGFKVEDHQSDSERSIRGRSTQSDSALLPSDVYFQRASPCPTSPCRAGAGTRRHHVGKEEEISRSLDKALEAALMMKKTTDRMARTLSADLAKARLYKSHTLHSLSDREKL